MKLVREHINEKFTEDSDPIVDMNIGTKNQILKDLEKIGIIESDVEFKDDYTFFLKDRRHNISQLARFIDVQLKYFPDGKKQLLSGLERSVEDVISLIEKAIKAGVSVKDILYITKYVLIDMTWGETRYERASRDLGKAQIYLAKLGRTKKKKKEEDENNIYVFIGYEGKVPITVNGKQYYTDKFVAETMIKFDKYDVGQLQGISMMKMRAQVQYNNEKGVGVYMFTVPKFIMDEDRYNEIPEQYYDLVDKYKVKIG